MGAHAGEPRRDRWRLRQHRDRTAPRRRRSRRGVRVTRWPVAAALPAVPLFLVVATQTRQGGWNDASRLAMVEAIAEHGHLWVDGTQMSRYTGDVARIDGKLYSDKPPALAFAAVPVYAAETALGITFRSALPRAY